MPDLKAVLPRFCGDVSCGAPYLSENFNRVNSIAAAGSDLSCEAPASAPSRDFTL